MTINTTVLDADKKLTTLKPTLVNITKKTVEEVTKIIPLTNLDIVFYEDKLSTIPQLGIGGYTLTNTVINISIDLTFQNIKDSLIKNLPHTLAHEMHHAAREYSGETTRTLLEAMVNEGIADHFSLELYGGKPYEWNTALTKTQLTAMLNKAKKELKDKEYDYNAWFFGSKEKGIPMWTGYSLGYYLVENYLLKTGKKPSQLLNTPAREFI